MTLNEYQPNRSFIVTLASELFFFLLLFNVFLTLNLMLGWSCEALQAS